MASSSKRSWKLQEFTAHNANVNCLALGHKSGRVLATGGDDKKVNLWAVGKPNCIMSLSGHATPIESVRFNNTEELVCAGSQTGALKVWDLEAAKLIKSLTGHKSGISTLDFHPYGDFIASGSHDCSIKLWDPRRKGCILTFIGHRSKVNSLKFSPDGQWIASSGEDSLVKVWDLRQGRTIHEFTEHTNSVTSVEFHPHDFLLATGGLDRTVHFWDLENFQLVSSERDVGAVKCLWFNPDGECLFTGVTDSLKVVGWEPARLFDSIPIGWGKVFDIATAHHQLVGASFHLTNVTVYIVDTKKVQPFGGPTPEIPTSPFSPGQSLRKSFSKERPVSLRTKQKLNVKTIEESTSGTDPEEDVTADITNIKDYSEVFQPNRSLTRTPPLVEPFQAPESDADPSEPQILSAPEDDYTLFTLHQLNLNENSSPPRIRIPNPVTAASGKGGEEHPPYKRPDLLVKPHAKYAQVNDETMFKKPEPPKPLRHDEYGLKRSEPVDIKILAADRGAGPSPKGKFSPDYDRSSFVPTPSDRPIGLDLEEFLPSNLRTAAYNNRLQDESEEDALDALAKDHNSTLALLTARAKALRLSYQHFRNSPDSKIAVERVLNMKDMALVHDVLNVLINRQSFWSLDMCVLVLPKIHELVQSRLELHIKTGCEAVKLTLRSFSSLIRSNMLTPCSAYSVDIPREERYQKCRKCYETLMDIRMTLSGKQNIGGELGNTFKELYADLNQLCIENHT